MIGIAAKLSRACSTSFVALTATKPSPITCTRFSPLAASSFSSFNNAFELDKTMAKPDVIDMIDYAWERARTDESVVSYKFGMLALDYCLTELTEGKDPQTENSKGITLLAKSTLMSERGKYADAIETLQSVHELTNSYLGIRVAAFEAQAGLHLELGQDVMASEVADKCIEFVEKQGTGDVEALTVRAGALKGLIELVNGNTKSAEDFFDKSLLNRLCDGSAALSYGEFLQTKQKYSMAIQVYENVLEGATDIKIYGNPYLGAGNMNLEGLVLGAMSALGQLESHLGAEKWLTMALYMAEKTYGPTHPKVGVVLTSIAHMHRRKAIKRGLSSLWVQEGLYEKVIDLLKVPSTESEPEGSASLADRSDIVALATGAYAEELSAEENRKDEGEKMKNMVEAMWRNRRVSLADAVGISKSNLCMVVDARISRLL